MRLVQKTLSLFIFSPIITTKDEKNGSEHNWNMISENSDVVMDDSYNHHLNCREYPGDYRGDGDDGEK